MDKPDSFKKQRFATRTLQVDEMARVCEFSPPESVVVEPIKLSLLRYAGDIAFSQYAVSKASLHSASRFPGAPVLSTLVHTRITRTPEWELALVRRRW